MRAVVQRVTRARVSIVEPDSAPDTPSAGADLSADVSADTGAPVVEVTGEIGLGLLVYLGIGPDDGEAEVRWMAAKIASLRIFPDDEGRFDRSVVDVGGGVLVVSQFTLYGDTRRGRRPSFAGAARPEVAAPTVEMVVDTLRREGLTVATGRFGAHMLVDALNDGPVTITLDTADLDRPR